MFTWAGDFQQALYKTFVLIVTALVMAFIWAYCHLPAGNLLMVILAALTAVRIAELPAGGKQLQELAVVITTGALLQYIVAITVLLPLLNVLLVSLASWLVLRFIRGSSAHIASSGGGHGSLLSLMSVFFIRCLDGQNIILLIKTWVRVT